MTIVYLTLLIFIAAEVTYLIKKISPIQRRDENGTTYVDTSSLMDGRIVTAAQTGFIPARLIVLRSVVNELQLLADKVDL